MPNLFHNLVHKSHINREVGEVFASVTIRTFGLGIVLIFIPIYLLEIGFSIRDIAVLYIVMNLLRSLVFNIPASKLIAKIGPKHTLSIGEMLYALVITTLYFMEAYPVLIFVFGLIYAMGAEIFWQSNHVEISYILDNKKETREIGGLVILRKIALALAPLIGGIIANRLGFEISLVVAATIIFSAVIPLLRTRETYISHSFSIKKRKKLKIGAKNGLANAAMNFSLTSGVALWVIYINIFLDSYEAIGEIVSLSLIISILVSAYLGREGDKKHRNKANLKFGSLFVSLVHLGRVIASTGPMIFFVNLLSEIAGLFADIPFTTIYYKNAAKDRLEYISKVQSYGSIGHAMPWVVILATSYFVDMKTSLIITFVAAALVATQFKRIAANN